MKTEKEIQKRFEEAEEKITINYKTHTQSYYDDGFRDALRWVLSS